MAEECPGDTSLRASLKLGRVLVQPVECLVSEVGLITTITTGGHAGALRTVEIALTSAFDRQQRIHPDWVYVLACEPAAENEIETARCLRECVRGLPYLSRAGRL